MPNSIFTATLNQMLVLFLFIAVGYILAKAKIVPQNAGQVLSKLENTVFIPALVVGTFMTNFTVEYLSSAWKLVVGSLALELIVIAISIPCVKLCSKDSYIRKIYLYGLCFSNFSFLGNVIVEALFPEIMLGYLLFTLMLWVLIYLWGVPALLMGNEGEKKSIGSRLKAFLNPMFIGMFIGMAIGLLRIPIPTVLETAITSAKNCMSPVAMLLTGMAIAEMDMRAAFKNGSTYAITALRLIVYPLVFIGVAKLIPSLSRTFLICSVCSLAMPIGMNTIVIPKGYGKDTKAASGMVLISHLISCLTIPLIFLLFEKLFG